MIAKNEVQKAQQRAVGMLEHADIRLTSQERNQIEIAEFGLGELESTGLELVVYVNTDRYCAKELVMFPRQTCPEHRHPPVSGDPGKMETFRCRWGRVWLYVEGVPTVKLKAHVPPGSEKYITRSFRRLN